MNFKFQWTCCNKYITYIDLHKLVLVTQLQDLNYCVVMMNLSYGGKLCGLLVSEGVKVAEGRIGKALQKVNPGYQQVRRSHVNHHLNPIPYQNDKLVMYGVTHICACDGYSGKVVGFISTLVKNNIEIYNHLFQ